MGNIARRRTLVAPAALLTVSLGATAQAGVEAYKVGDATIYTEGLTNKILRTNDFEDWSKQSRATPATSTFMPHTFACGENHHDNHEIH